MNKEEIYKWLDKNIEVYERTVIILQHKVDNYDKVPQGPLDPFEQQPKEFYIEQLNHYKNLLNMFKQIKTELEAWEVILKYEDVYNIRKQAKLGLIGGKRVKEDTNKLKKALEVEDE